MLRTLTIASVLLLFEPIRCSAGMVVSLGARWDAAPRVINGNERSLDGGIRYAWEGGSAQAFRDRFSWQQLPTVADFESAITQAFSAWTVTDPASGLMTALQFASDPTTTIERQAGFGTLNVNGAEIDLLASDAGSGALMGLTSIGLQGAPVTLTSGVSDYASSVSIQGVDLHMNSNAQALYTLDAFRRILTHEIGHAIGLGDVDQGGSFIDDNYDASAPVETLTNSWAVLVNPLDPAASVSLSSFSVPPTDFSLPGVDILMESYGLGLSEYDSISELYPLRNDDYSMRQYLYPSISAVPEPSSILLLLLVVLGSTLHRFSKRNEGFGA